MHTEFENVDLNLIRYSLVWEGANTLYNGLNIKANDDLLMITSAGCNVLNALLKDPRSLTAIDLNPEQNRLLLFKKHVIEHHDHKTFSSIMGFRGRRKVEAAWKKIGPSLDPVLRQHWDGFFKNYPSGIIGSGKLESYILGFFPNLPSAIQLKVWRLFKFDDLNKQYAFFLKELDGTTFQASFIEYFDRQNLSRGRDPKLFKYVKESGGQIFYSRLKAFVETRLLKTNFHLWFFMFGLTDIPENILPPCYRKENFFTLKDQLGKLKVVTGEAMQYLMSPAGKQINKAGLSNIFEYVDEKSFSAVITKLSRERSESLRIIYWNLLQPQGETLSSEVIQLNKSRELSGREDCFYFHNVRLLKIIPQKVSTSIHMKTSDYFTTSYLEKMMQEQEPQSDICVYGIREFPVDNSASILSTLNAGTTGMEIGHFGLEVSFSKNRKQHKRKMVMKVKPHGKVTASMLTGLSEFCGASLKDVYPKYESLTGFSNTHMRELEVYKKKLSPVQPEIFGLSVDENNETFIVLMEYLEEVELLNSVMSPEKWTREYIETALLQIAQWHASHLNLTKGLDMQYWKEDVPGKDYMVQLQPLWRSLLQHASSTLPEIYTPENKAVLKRGIEKIPDYWSELERMPRTLIHNDFNPRNICFKRENNQPDLCLYDWELATFHVPQYDVVEFLSFVLIPENYNSRLDYLEFYRAELSKLTGRFLNPEEFQKGFAYAALDFGLHRLGMYVMAHSVSPYPFLPRVLHSYFDTLKQVKYLLP